MNPLQHEVEIIVVNYTSAVADLGEGPGEPPLSSRSGSATGVWLGRKNAEEYK